MELGCAPLRRRGSWWAAGPGLARVRVRVRVKGGGRGRVRARVRARVRVRVRVLGRDRVSVGAEVGLTCRADVDDVGRT